jgi:hypothetical protein
LKYCGLTSPYLIRAKQNAENLLAIHSENLAICCGGWPAKTSLFPNLFSANYPSAKNGMLDKSAALTGGLDCKERNK